MPEAPDPGPVIIHADGRSDADGVCTWGFVATSPAGARVHEASGRADNPYGDATSLVAEWRAAVEALRWVRATQQARNVLLRVDAALVEKGLRTRRLAVSGYEGALAIEAREHVAALKGRGVHVHVERVPRWRNAHADGLAQEALAPSTGDREKPGVPPPSRRRRR